MRIVLASFLALAACLPEGGPGVGERLIDGRGLADLMESREATPGAFWLYTRAAESAGAGEEDAQLRDLFALPRAGGQERRIATRLQPGVRGSVLWFGGGALLRREPRVERGSEASRPPAPNLPAEAMPPADMMGAPRGAPSPRTSFELVIVDVASGETRSLGRALSLRLSASRRALYLESVEGGGRIVDPETDSPVREVGPATRRLRQVRFLDEHLAFIDDAGLGWLSSDDPAPRRLLPRVTTYRIARLPDGHRVLLALRPTLANPKHRELVVLDPRDPMMEPRLLASGPLLGDPFLAPAGDRVAFVVAGDSARAYEVRVLDLLGKQLVQVGFTFPQDPAPDSEGRRFVTRTHEPPVDISFRPRSDELWCFIDQRQVIASPGGFRLVLRASYTTSRLGGVPIPEAVVDPDEPRRRVPRGGLFTSDGKRWVFRSLGGQLRLGNADDPDSEAGVELSGPNRAGGAVQLDGPDRFAVLSAPGDDRVDLQLLDLAQGETPRFLARDVATWSLGRERVLAIARKLGDRRATGDLVLVDLVSGGETLLAHNVAEVALARPCDACDPTGPGQPFAYAVQTRVPYRTEGLWQSALP